MAHRRLLEELGQVEKVRGEFTDLLRRLETALTQAQVSGDNQKKNTDVTN